MSEFGSLAATFPGLFTLAYNVPVTGIWAYINEMSVGLPGLTGRQLSLNAANELDAGIGARLTQIVAGGGKELGLGGTDPLRLFLGGLERLFGAPAFGDVADEAADQFPAAVGQNAGRHLDRNQAAALGPVSRLEGRGSTRLDIGPDVRPVRQVDVGIDIGQRQNL